MRASKSIALAVIAVVVASSLGLSSAEAKRAGSGRDVGRQAPANTIQRSTTPATPATTPGAAPGTPAAPASPAAAAPRPATPAPAAAPARNRWLGPIAGLAAGLGLAALASHFGFGEQLANAMMIGLLVMAVLAVVAFIMKRRASAVQGREPAYAGGGGYGMTGLGQEASVPNYPPARVPDASRDQPIDTVRAAATPVAAGALPQDFDSEGFLRAAKVCFVRLQAAYDAGNSADLREFTSPEMFAELKLEIDSRHGAANQTDVVTLDGALLGVESSVTEQLASVRFTGMIREEAGAAAAPFDEVWNFSRPIGTTGGWVLAGIQQLDRA
jgi:predicted lipid-binding transport protein (Tim44 family)